MDFLPDEKTMCHHAGFEKSCRDMVVNCACRKWVQVRGTNPNTGEEINRFDCADAWMPILLVENAQQQRQTGAAIESFRNEVVKSNQDAARVIAATALPRHNGRMIAIEGKNET